MGGTAVASCIQVYSAEEAERWINAQRCACGGAYRLGATRQQPVAQGQLATATCVCSCCAGSRVFAFLLPRDGA